MPILTSTALLPAAAAARSCARLGHVPRSAGARPATDTTPGEPRHPLLGGVLRDGPIRAQPVPGAHLGHADETHAEQVRLGIGDPGVLADDLADHLRTVLQRTLEPLPHGRFVAQIGLEDEPERLAFTRDEVEERAEGGCHPLLVLCGGRERVPY